MSNTTYWTNRKAKQMFDYLESSERVSQEVADLYWKASRQINYEIDNIFERYRDKFDLTDDDAMALLNELRDSKTIEELKSALAGKPDSVAKKEILAQLESPAYASRIARYQELQNKIDMMMQDIYKQEKAITSKHYVDVAADSYYKGIYNIQQQKGLAFDFTMADYKLIGRLLNSEWSGKDYSKRIWGNTETLAKEVKGQIALSLVTGKKNEEIARELANKFSVGAYKARRLIRTETNYVCNQLDAESMKECDIEWYRYNATLDLRTSEICRSLDGKRFRLSDMKVGVNYPPMHPFCRSVVGPDITDEVLKTLKRRARDPVTGETMLVPADMTYEQWYKKYVKGNAQAEANEVKEHNRAADRKQYEKYREVLGKKAGKSVEDFRDIKYNTSEPELWEKMQTSYKDRKLQSRIQSDEYNKTVIMDKQNQHIPGAKEYVAGKSYITIAPEEIQDMVTKYAGTGTILRDSNGKWKSQEVIHAPKNIGVSINNMTGVETPTSYFKIHYRKTGVHIVPTLLEGAK